MNKLGNMFRFKSPKVHPSQYTLTFWPICKKNNKLALVTPMKPLNQKFLNEPNFPSILLTTHDIQKVYNEDPAKANEFKVWRDIYIPGPITEQRTLAVTIYSNKISKVLHADFYNKYIHIFSHPDEIKEHYYQIQNIITEPTEPMEFSETWYKKQLSDFYVPMII